MREELWKEIQQQEAEVAHGDKARPIMAILEDLKRVSIEIDFAIDMILLSRPKQSIFFIPTKGLMGTSKRSVVTVVQSIDENSVCKCIGPLIPSLMLCQTILIAKSPLLQK